MGGGGIIGDGCEGLVVDPHNSDGWISAIRKVFTDDVFRLSISRNAYNKAGEYVWSNVGQRRRELLLASLNNKGIPN